MVVVWNVLGLGYAPSLGAGQSSARLYTASFPSPSPIRPSDDERGVVMETIRAPQMSATWMRETQLVDGGDDDDNDDDGGGEDDGDCCCCCCCCCCCFLTVSRADLPGPYMPVF